MHLAFVLMRSYFGNSTKCFPYLSTDCCRYPASTSLRNHWFCLPNCCGNRLEEIPKYQIPAKMTRILIKNILFRFRCAPNYLVMLWFLAGATPLRSSTWCFWRSRRNNFALTGIFAGLTLPALRSVRWHRIGWCFAFSFWRQSFWNRLKLNAKKEEEKNEQINKEFSALQSIEHWHLPLDWHSAKSLPSAVNSHCSRRRWTWPLSWQWNCSIVHRPASNRSD